MPSNYFLLPCIIIPFLVVHRNDIAQPVVTDQVQKLGQQDEPQDSSPENEVTEFNLMFGSEAESSESESELMYHEEDEDLMGKKIMMDLPNHGPSSNMNTYDHTVQRKGGDTFNELTSLKGYANGERERDYITEPRRVSLDQLDTAEQNGFVVTNAVVTIG